MDFVQGDEGGLAADFEPIALVAEAKMDETLLSRLPPLVVFVVVVLFTTGAELTVGMAVICDINVSQ